MVQKTHSSHVYLGRTPAGRWAAAVRFNADSPPYVLPNHRDRNVPVCLHPSRCGIIPQGLAGRAPGSGPPVSSLPHPSIAVAFTPLFCPLLSLFTALFWPISVAPPPLSNTADLGECDPAGGELSWLSCSHPRRREEGGLGMREHLHLDEIRPPPTMMLVGAGESRIRWKTRRTPTSVSATFSSLKPSLLPVFSSHSPAVISHLGILNPLK